MHLQYAARGKGSQRNTYHGSERKSAWDADRRLRDAILYLKSDNPLHHLCNRIPLEGWNLGTRTPPQAETKSEYVVQESPVGAAPRIASLTQRRGNLAHVTLGA